MNATLLRPPRCGGTVVRPPSHTNESDRLLVLTLAVILVQNHAPIELIVALLYIAM